jgi:hypothetical protein
MSDIKDEVVEDRGVIKKIQLIFPGYHGYRINEDLRDADIILKDELYKRMLGIIDQLKGGEAALVRNGIFKNLDLLGLSRSKMQTSAENLKHHGAGYSGISAPVRVTTQKISALYDLDMKIFDQIQSLESSVRAFIAGCEAGNLDIAKLQGVNAALANIDDLNNSRDRLLYGGV